MDEGRKNQLTRRRFLTRTAGAAAAAGIGWWGPAISTARAAAAARFGPLGPPNADGLRLPPGFSSRIVATTGYEVAATGYVWHTLPDGGATFARADGGWVYVSNCEASGGSGGVGAIRFAPDGSIEASYPILSGTSRNCAGGPTPWQTWLSCEETSDGRVWECDPFAPDSTGLVRPALGVFQHEAAAVDPIRERIYLTEDRRDGLLYRFSPTHYPDLATGLLEAAEILDPNAEGEIEPGQIRPLTWHTIPDPSAATTPTRAQAPGATPFDGGEGCWYRDGEIVFSTKGDDRVWRLDTATDRIEILYDRATSQTPILSGVDNVFTAPTGDIYVAEDPGDLQIVALTRDGGVVPIVQVTGQAGSEVTGPALSPDGTRLYFSSQRGPGTTYEVRGPFTATETPGLGAVGQLGLVAALAGGASYAIRDVTTRLKERSSNAP